jgi:expansin (peptidoglycan-binding protein)
VTYSESYASASYSAAPYSYAAASYASASYPSASYAASSAAEAAAGNAENAPGPTASSSANNAASTSQVETGGFATFYYQNGNAGACNNYNPDSALIGAIDVSWYGNTGVASPLCGQQVLITNTDNGKQVTITIQDACPTCVNNNCIDLSVAAFDTIADPSTGMVPIKWEFL